MSTEKLSSKHNYKISYTGEIGDFISKIKSKKIVPYQVEIQPGNEKSKKLCWLECPYCYGATSFNVKKRLSKERYVSIINEICNHPFSKVQKLIFAGYATDPLFYEHIYDLIKAAVDNTHIFGIHSKLIKINDKLAELITDNNVLDGSYIVVSMDSGSAEIYNKVHDVKSKANIYEKVLKNIKKLSELKRLNNSKLDIGTNYLITNVNNKNSEIEKAIQDFLNNGSSLVRFSFPQLPRGKQKEVGTIIPDLSDRKEIAPRVSKIIEKFKSHNIFFSDPETSLGIDGARTLPCFSRFIYPAVGYDGNLYHCSQSASPVFDDMKLGDLVEKNFWELYYNYNPDKLEDMLQSQHQLMKKNDCRCDRKEHVTNLSLKDYKNYL